MEPIEYLRAIRRRWKIVAITLIGGLAVGFLTTATVQSKPAANQWEARTVLLHSGAGNLSTMGALTTIGEIPERVAERIGYEGDPLDLAAKAVVTPDESTSLLYITVTSPDRKEARLLAELFPEELIKFLTEQNALSLVQETEALEEQIRRLRQQANELDERIASAKADELDTLVTQRDAKFSQAESLSRTLDQIVYSSGVSPGLRVVENPVSRPALPAESQTVLDGIGGVVIAGVLGLMAGVGIILVLERFDTRIRNRQGAEEHFGLPVLSEIPRIRRANRREVISVADPQSPAADAFRLLGAGVIPSRVDQGNGDGGGTADKRSSSRTVMVTSCGPGEGKSTVVANLAATLAEVGHRVLVLSYDFRRPAVHQMLGVSGSRGLADGINPGEGRVLERRIYQTRVPGVRLVPSMSKPERATELLASGDLQRAITEARETADVVILDTAPLLASGDVPRLLPGVDTVVVVARARRTKAELAERTGEILKRFGAPVQGVVLVGGDVTLPQGYYRYQEETH